MNNFIIVIGVLVLSYFYFNHKRNKTIQPQKQESLDEQDLIQHNGRVLSQINDYIEQKDTKNYSHENIALGTTELHDHHDIY
jgi:hypothetical protein